MEDELRRLENRSSSFRGSARIHLKHLLFEEPKGVSLSLHLDSKNVARLVKVFELEGCLRLEEEHRVPAVINEAILQEALSSSSLTNADLLTTGVPPELQLPQFTRLNCLHGRHRIAAAQQTLLPGNKWWTVDLYTEGPFGGSIFTEQLLILRIGLDESTYRDLREEYANERNFCDGDIYRHLRHSQLSGNSTEEGRWLARLSECKRKDVKQLQRRSELRPLTSALDNLLPFSGFWPALQIGTFHRLLSLKCPEVSFVSRHESHNHSLCSLGAGMLSPPHPDTMGLNTWGKRQLQMSSGFQDCPAVANTESVHVALGSRVCTRANERRDAVPYHHGHSVAPRDFVSTGKKYMYHPISVHLS